MSKIKRRLYSHIEQYSLKHKYIVSTKQELADKLNISLSALNSNLKKLEQEGKIVTTTKRGNNGGFIVTLNNLDLEEFNNSNDNVIESSKEYVEQLREEIFPTYQYNYQGKRRTKVEMIKYKAIKDKQRKVIVDMNFYFNDLLYPDKKLFEMSYDPQGFYNAYILCKLFNQYLAMFCKHKYEETLEDKYSYKMQYYLREDCTPNNFFGSRDFNIFYKLQDILERRNLNVFKYMQNVIKNVDWEHRQGYKVNFVPQPNYLLSEKYLERYEKYSKAIKSNINNTQRHLGNTELLIDSSIFTQDLIVQQLQQLYIEGLNCTKVDMETIFNNALDVKDVMLGLVTSEKQVNLINFNYEVESKVSHLPKEEQDLINNYVKQLIINEYDSTNFSNSGLLSMFTLEREYYLSNVIFNTQNSLYNYKNFIATLNQQPNEYVGYSYLLYRKFKPTLYISRMYGDLKGYETNLKDLHNVLEKNNLKGLIPFKKYGTLDYDNLKGRYAHE